MRLEQPFVAVFIGPELLFVCAADSGLAGFLELRRQTLLLPRGIDGGELRAFLADLGLGRLDRARLWGRFRWLFLRRGGLGRSGFLLAAMLFGPCGVLGFDAGLNRLDFRRAGLGEERGQLVFVGPLPILNLGLLGERLELRRFQLADLILKGEVKDGSTIKVDEGDGALKLSPA